MLASVVTVAFEGVDARRVDVQVQQLPCGDHPSFNIVGLADKAVAESRERVRGAFAGIGLALPPKRIIVNMAPADLPKEGSHFDLPIALALLASMGVIPSDMLSGWAAVGELGLDGRIAPVGGTLPAAVAVDAMGLGLICPEANGPEAAWAGEVAVLAPRSLIGLVNHFKGTQVLRRPEPGAMRSGDRVPDLREVKGQESAKRALEIAAAGGHNLLMDGPPSPGPSHASLSKVRLTPLFGLVACTTFAIVGLLATAKRQVRWSVTVFDDDTLSRDGVTLLKGVFDATAVQHMKRDADRLRAIFDGHVENVRTEHLAGLWGGLSLGKIDPVLDVSEVFASIQHNSTLRDFARAALKSDSICLYRDKLIYCPPGVAGYRLHADYAWWGEREPKEYCTFAIFLDGCSEQSGPIEYFIGSHLLEIAQGSMCDINPSDAAGLEGCQTLLSVTDPGDVIAFHSKCVHWSYPNLSDNARTVLYLTYCTDKQDNIYDVKIRQNISRAIAGGSNLYFQ